MASRSRRRAGSDPAPKRRSRRAAPENEAAAHAHELEEVAARLNITVERVLEEYARIAFADLGHIVDWKSDSVVIKPVESIDAADTAAIAEITAAGSGGASYRVKMYNKKAALDAIARCLGMFPPPAQRQGGEAPSDASEDPREVLKRRLARLAASGDEELADRRADEDPGGHTQS